MPYPSFLDPATLDVGNLRWWMLWVPLLVGLVVFAPLIIFWRRDARRDRLVCLAAYVVWLVFLTGVVALLGRQVGDGMALAVNAFNTLVPHAYFGLWLLAVPVFVLGVVLAPWTVLQRREGRRHRLHGSLRAIGLVLIAALVFYHGERAYDRAMVTPQQCRTHGPSPDEAYEVEVCLTRGNTGLSPEGFVNLRAFKGGQILARRTLYNDEYGRVRWSSDEVIVGSADGRAEFQLPPGRWEKWLAFLP